MGIIKTCSEYLNESAWGEMRRRSSGEITRKEDEVNHLDIDGLLGYAQEKYSDRIYKIDSEEIRGFQGWKNCVVFPFDDDLEITITFFLDTGKIRDITIMWDKNGVQDSFIRKLNDRFNICLAPRENAYIDIKDKNGSVSNQTYIDLLDFVLENGQDNVLLESAWGEMRRRSSGQQIRREDDINIKSPEEFFDYLRSHYRIDNSSWDMTNNEDSLTLCIPFCGMNVKKVYHIFCLFFDYEEDVIYIHNNHQKFTPNLWNKLNKHYDLWKDEPDYDGYTIINPLDTSRPVNNSYVIEVLNFIIDNMDSNATLCIFKKTNESAWGEMRRRSSGQIVRKEDDINHLNMEDFWEYLCNTYKSMDPNRDVIGFPSDNIITFPFVCHKIEFNVWFQFKGSRDKILYIVIPDISPWWYPNIEDDFKLESYPNDEKYISVFPKDGSKLTNSFAVTVIDYLLNNSDNKNKNLFIKKERS